MTFCKILRLWVKYLLGTTRVILKLKGVEICLLIFFLKIIETKLQNLKFNFYFFREHFKPKIMIINSGMASNWPSLSLTQAGKILQKFAFTQKRRIFLLEFTNFAFCSKKIWLQQFAWILPVYHVSTYCVPRSAGNLNHFINNFNQKIVITAFAHLMLK